MTVLNIEIAWHDDLFQGIWSQAIEYFLCDTGLKTYSLQRIYKLLSAFATYKFLKDNSSWILHLKSQKFHQLLRFPSSKIL